MKKYYKIAGLTVEMDSFGKTVAQAEAYSISDVDMPDVYIENSSKEYLGKYPNVSDDDCEYIYTGANFYKQLINYNGIMLHSSAVVMNGKAYLFAAPCGTGKSTHTSLWLQMFGENAYILNDDKPAIRLEDGVFFAYGTPWSGKTNQNVNVRVPIGGICIISRGKYNEIVRIHGKEAIIGIYSQTLHPQNEKYIDKVFSLLEVLINSIPIWRLKCNMELEAAKVAYEAMSGMKLDRDKF